MSRIILSAHAKTNVSLRVLRRREDGFHDLRTRMTLLSLADTLTVELLGPGKGLQLEIDGADWSPRPGEENLVQAAARVFAAHTGLPVDAHVHLEKRIPSGAGLGGGSSDAATMLKALDHLHGTALGKDVMVTMAAEIGSDVPFFIHGQWCECSGRGEIIVPVDVDWELPIVLLKPAFGVATPEAYRRWAGSQPIPGVLYVPQVCPWGEMVNDLERPVFGKYPVLAQMKMWLLDQPEVHAALMSGSGSTMLAVLSSQHGGERLAERARREFGDSLWTHVGQTLCEAQAPESHPDA